MVYRLYLETVKKDAAVAFAFAFYNHQDFMVYKRAGKVDNANEEQTILEQACVALTYFEKSMRRRYYDEHFSTRIDEDYVTLFTKMPEIANVAKKCKTACSIGFIGEHKEAWEALVPFFAQKTMSFENASDERFMSTVKELAAKQFE